MAQLRHLEIGIDHRCYWVQYIVEMNITDFKKLQLLIPGIAKLHTRRLMDKTSCQHCQQTSYIFPQLQRLKLI